MRRRRCLIVARFGFLGLAMLALAHAGHALEFDVGGRPLRVMGSLNQGVGFGIGGDKFDTQEGFQSAIFDAILEAEYRPTSNVKLFGVAMLTGDWAYPILEDDSDWKRKEFDKSRNELYMDTDFNDVAQELHATWTPGSFLFRAGKQIVVWGETDGFRIMDQINPIDQRRGLSDVEFESTILPLWMLRAEYYTQPVSTWLQELSFETVFNPNAYFQPNRPIVTGNDEAGIWAALVKTALPPPPIGPGGTGLLGSFERFEDEPEEWDSEGMEIGLRVRSVINDAIVTVNYFDGLDNSPVLQSRLVDNPFPVGPPQLPVADVDVVDGNIIVHPHVDVTYERFRYLGATFTRDFPSLSSSFLGGVGPVLRLEGFYGFSNTFMSEDLLQTKELDELRYALGVDWKIKVSPLNPRAYFLLSAQFYHRHIFDYPDEFNLTNPSEGGIIKDDNYQTSFMINTSYFHNKLIPSFFWLKDWTRHSSFYRYQLVYERSSTWNYTLGALFLDGNDEGQGFEPLRHKDQVYFTVSYRF